jgi:YVTN family beta-propeller protein
MLIDPTTDKVVGEIGGIEVGHGVAPAPDGSRIYVTNESLMTVDVVDVPSLSVIKRIPLTGPPNNIAVRKDGQRVYAAITGANGGVDIIDTAKLEKIKFIRVLGGVHNPIMTPDSKFVVAGSIGSAQATVIDTQLERAVWSINFADGEGVRVFCFDWNPDGSTKRLFVQLSNVHGFAIVDWERRREVGRIMLPEIPVAERNSEGIQGAPAHGILVTPDGKQLWSTSKWNSRVYAYSMPDLKYLGEVKVGLVPDWITFTPDSKKLYVANAHDNTVSVIDVPGRKEITRIKVGQIPKRNATGIFPALPSGTK